MADVLLHLIDPTTVDLDWARSALTPDERARADRFVFPADARRWSCVRATCRQLLADHLKIRPDELQWELGAHDKPTIAGHDLAFNLSHGDSLSALGIASTGPIGVDLELRIRGQDLVADLTSFCHPEEIARLPQGDKAETLIELWTAKEAFLKALGTGLSLPPEQVSVHDNLAHGPLAGFESLHLLRPKHPRLDQHAIAIAVPSEIHGVEVVEAQR